MPKAEFDVFTDEAFRAHLIATHGLPKSAQVFCASRDVYFGLDEQKLVDELGDGDGGLGWAFGFEGAMERVVEMQEDKRISLSVGSLAVGVRCGKQERYFIEDIKAFLANQEKIKGKKEG